MDKRILFSLLVVFVLLFVSSCSKKDKGNTLSKNGTSKVESVSSEVTSIPNSWNGGYALKNYPSEKILVIKDGKIFQIVEEEESEIFPAKTLDNGYVVKIDENECSASADTSSFKYVRNSDGSISFSTSGAEETIIEYVKL